MAKKCIFCGEPISEKSREHVIPQWLIEMTGEKKRIAAFGIDYSEIFEGRQESEKTKYRKYPFLQFTFPACKKCNETYGSTLEVDAKHVITKVLTEQKINAEEIAILLNWFDKVRIGLWLGYLYYNEQLESLDPKFYINDRIGKKDRALFIYKCKEEAEGINMVGPGGMLFSMIPSCFLLRINNYFFLNISKDALLLKDLGYPYPVMRIIDNKGNMCGTMIEATGKINQKLLSEYRIRPTTKAIFQPVFEQIEEAYKSQGFDIRRKPTEQYETIGNIYIKDGEIRRIGENEEYLIKPKEEYENLYGLMNVLGRKVSRILIEFANEIKKQTEESELIEEQKIKMLAEVHTAITMEESRVQHIKFELEDLLDLPN